MKFVLLYSFKRLWRSKEPTLLTALFLCLGFWGWLLSEGTQTSIRERLAQNAQKILSADLTIDVRREFTDDENKRIHEVLQGQGIISKSYEFFAMLSSGKETRLVQVRAIDDFYPFYGHLELEKKSSAKDLVQEQIWAYRELKDLMNLQDNDRVQLGKAQFQIQDFVLNDETQTFRLASLAPRIFIHVDQLKKTELIQFGSTFSAIQLVKMTPKADLERITENLKKSLKDPGINITSFKTLPDELSGPTQRLSDFLGLASLVSLLFCSLTLFYLLQIWSGAQQKEKAALAIFGLSLRKIQLIELLQSIQIAILSTFFSSLLVWVSTPVVEKAIHSWFAQDFVFKITFRETLLILVCQLVLLTVLTFPGRLGRASLTSLLRDELHVHQRGIALFLPLFGLIWPFAVFASRSWKNGSYFFGAILAVCLVLILIGRFLLVHISRIQWPQWTLTYATKALSRQTTGSWAFIVTVGVCSALLNLMPQIQSSLENLMTLEGRSRFPSLFLFDIQQEQLTQLTDLLNQEGLKPQSVAPLVRARILKVNGEPFEREQVSGTFVTREEQVDARMKNRTVNLTYRSGLQKDEKIVEGVDFSGEFNSQQKYAFVSIEKNYAKRLRLKIDDLLTFYIQGIEVIAQVKNFREVKWSRFEPNFFIAFQDGVINDAPQTFLAALPPLSSSEKSHITKAISGEFGNISMIDVERLIMDLVKNLERVSGALKLMTGLSFMTGLLALIFLLISENLHRASEIHLMKILGADLSSTLRARFNEVGILSLISLLVGLGSSYLIAGVIMTQVFQISFTPEFGTAALIACVILLIAFLLVRIITGSIYKQNSLLFLRKEE
jgi:putative ABC transport system permease protein